MRGSIAKKGKKWYAVVYDGPDRLTGKDRRRWVMAGTRKGDAEKLLAELIQRKYEGETVVNERVTLELGLRASHDEPLGKQSPVRHAIDRLEHSHLVQWLAHDHLAVQTEAPVANEHTLARLPETAAEAHRDFLATLHLNRPMD